MLDLARLAARLLRRHLWLYAGCMVTVGASAALAAAEATLVVGFSHPETVSVTGLSAEEVATGLVAVRGLIIILATIAIFTCAFLVWSAVKQVVTFRQRELALMRLAGASRGLLARGVSLECSILALAVSLPASLVGELLATPLFWGLQAIEFFGKGVQAQFGLSLVVPLIIAPVLALVSGLAGAFAALAATRGDLLAAVNPVARRMSGAQVVLRLLVGLISAGCIAILDPVSLGANLLFVLPLLVIVPLVALAPLLVPLGAWVIGQTVGLFAPGAGILAAERASRERIRFARLATPVIVAIGVLGGFLVANAPDEQIRAAAYEQRLGASVVAMAAGPSTGAAVAEALDAAGATRVARWTSRQRSVSGDPTRLYFTDPDEFAELLHQGLLSGTLADVGGLAVASSDPSAELGDELQTTDAAGRPVTLKVVALLQDEDWTGVWFDWAELPRMVANPVELSVEVFASPTTQQQALAAVAQAGIEAQVVDRAGYVAELEAARAANTYRSNVGLFGTVYLMCLISLFQSAVSNSVARRREFRLLASLGVDRRGITLTGVTETLIVQLVAGVLIAAILVAFGVRFAAINGTSAMAAIASVAPETGVGYLSVVIAALGAQLIGTRVALSTGAGLDSTETSDRL